MSLVSFHIRAQINYQLKVANLNKFLSSSNNNWRIINIIRVIKWQLFIQKHKHLFFPNIINWNSCFEKTDISWHSLQGSPAIIKQFQVVAIIWASGLYQTGQTYHYPTLPKYLHKKSHSGKFFLTINRLPRSTANRLQ